MRACSSSRPGKRHPHRGNWASSSHPGHPLAHDTGSPMRSPFPQCTALEATMTHRLFAVAMGLLGIVFVVEPATAQAPKPEQIIIKEGIAHPWQSPRPFKDIIQGDDSIVQVTAGPTDRDLILVGKSLGATNILVFDPQGTLISNLNIFVGRAVDKTRIYGRAGNLHAYWAHSCTSTGCGKIADENEGYERIPQASPPVTPGNPGLQPPTTQRPPTSR